MRRQLRRLGLGHDTRREIATTDPAFYRWTQWIFLKIFNSWCDERTGQARRIEDLVSDSRPVSVLPPDGRLWGDLSSLEQRKIIDGYRLAYISEELVNWCPGLGTVLANEEVTADGRSDVGNYPVYRRPLRQWMLRITAFAERLIDDLDLVEWPEPVKLMQRNWIGTSEGASVNLRFAGKPGPVESRCSPPVPTPSTARPTWCWPPSTRSSASSYPAHGQAAFRDLDLPGRPRRH